MSDPLDSATDNELTQAILALYDEQRLDRSLSDGGLVEYDFDGAPKLDPGNVDARLIDFWQERATLTDQQFFEEGGGRVDGYRVDVEDGEVASWNAPNREADFMVEFAQPGETPQQSVTEGVRQILQAMNSDSSGTDVETVSDAAEQAERDTDGPRSWRDVEESSSDNTPGNGSGNTSQIGCVQDSIKTKLLVAVGLAVATIIALSQS